MKNLLLLLALLVAPALAVTVSVDGQTLPSQPAPMIDQGRVLVPLRAVFQALDAKVDYSNQTITATRGASIVELRPGQRTALVNSKRVSLDSPARLKSGTTYVPLRFVAQALGEKVAWQASTKSVIIGEGLATKAQSSPTVANDTGVKPLLKRLVVGNQGGVLKVRSSDGQSVVYYRGLDDRSTAPLSIQDQQKILGELGMLGRVDESAMTVMGNYSTLPKKEALALLGVVNSLPESQKSAGTSEAVRRFLVGKMKTDKSVYNRRQAVLSLAVGSQVDGEVVAAVLDFYRSSENLWETFPVQQFFEYQAMKIKQMPQFQSWKQSALSVNSLYRDNITGYLN